jgi:hypothetical protein
MAGSGKVRGFPILRRFYRGVSHVLGQPRELLDIPGCVAHAVGEMNKWITKDRKYKNVVFSGLSLRLGGSTTGLPPTARA